MANLSAFTPIDIIAGDADIRTKQVDYAPHIAMIPAFTPMKRDSAFLVVPATSIHDEVVGLSIPDTQTETFNNVGFTPASTIVVTGNIYTSIDIFYQMVNLSDVADVTDYNSVSYMFDRSGINVVNTPGGW